MTDHELALAFGLIALISLALLFYTLALVTRYLNQKAEQERDQ